MIALDWRDTVRPEDRQAVRGIVAGSGFFNEAEVDVAVELVDESLARGAERSGYHFLFAERQGQVVGYSCWGPIAGTVNSWDLYWIAVAPARRRTGLGGSLLRQTEARVAGRGGGRIYIETSSRDLYAPTQGFYRHHGYAEEARLSDFYAPGDSKIIYVRVVAPA